MSIRGELVRALGGVPPQIREAILCGSTKSTTEEEPLYCVHASSGSTAPISVRWRPLSYPVGELVRALGSAVASTSLLGVPLGHNSLFLQGPTVLRVKVVGIRSINKEGPEQGKRSGLYLSVSVSLFCSSLLSYAYPSLFIDVDEPGGLSFHDVLNILHSLQGDVFAADVVEFNPQRYTVDGMTAMVAAKLYVTEKFISRSLIPYPVVRALSETLGGPVVDILHLDAHPDIYKAFEVVNQHFSQPPEFGCGIFRLVLDQSTKKGVNKENDLALNNMKCEPFHEIVIFGKCWSLFSLPPSLSHKLGEGVKGVYILIDVDCLDPAFAPGVSHIEPGVFPSVMFSTYSTASKATLLLQMSLNSTRSATLLMG
ncbi:unnamed protein product [Prunus armeniaca]|uniref:Uncharacterized protein n=1 Tax=Prunus armeniaca TaxID=36596 RepID=A0A6J5U027_PRUAR|nr:unnamed protein product [Prunus armeniaca]